MMHDSQPYEWRVVRTIVVQDYGLNFLNFPHLEHIAEHDAHDGHGGAAAKGQNQPEYDQKDVQRFCILKLNAERKNL